VRDTALSATLIGHQGVVDSMVMDQGGRLFSSSSVERTVRSWHPGTDDVTVLAGCEYQRSFALNPSLGELSIGQPGGQIQRWSLVDLAPLDPIPSPGSHVVEVEYSRDGDRLFACTHDGWIRSWRLPSLKPDVEQNLQLGEIGRASFDRNGEWLIVGSLTPARETAVHVMDLPDLASSGPSKPIPGVSTYLQAVSGSSPLVGGSGGEVWAIDTGSRSKRLLLLTDPMSCLCADAAGARLLIGHSGSVALWESGRRQWLTEGIGETVASAAFHPTEPRVAVGTVVGGLEILDARDGRRLLRLGGHIASISDLVFSATGDRLFSCSTDGTVRVWSTR